MNCELKELEKQEVAHLSQTEDKTKRGNYSLLHDTRLPFNLFKRYCSHQTLQHFDLMIFLADQKLSGVMGDVQKAASKQ